MEAESEVGILKKELKCWESMFARKYGRKPSKEDIDQSSAEIRDSYKRYTYLKCKTPGKDDTITPVKQQQKEGDDGVFSASLNKKPKEPPEKVSHFKKESSCWRPKLKITKQNIIKPVEKNDVENVENFQNEELGNIEISTPEQKMMTPPNRRTIGSMRKKLTSSTRFKHVSQDLLNTCNDYLNRFEDTPLKKDPVDPASRNNESPGSVNSDLPSNSVNNTNNSDVLKEILPNMLFPSVNPIEKKTNPVEISSLKPNSGSDISLNESCKTNDKVTSKLFSEGSGHAGQLKKKDIEKSACGNDDDKTDSIPLSKMIQNVDFTIDTASPPETKSISKTPKISEKRPKRKTKNKTNIENVSESGDVFDFPVGDGDGDEDPTYITKTTNKKKSTRGTKKNKTQATEDDEPSEEITGPGEKRKRETDTGEKSNVKKRKKVAADKSEENNPDSMETNTKESDKVSKKAPVKKTTSKASKLVSDNFVKIDIKKKTYVRGLKKMTGAQMKRNEWKRKTAFERPIKTSKTGKSICFKCGGEGHWAKNCKEMFKKKTNTIKDVDEEKYSMEFQHLNEASGRCFSYENGDGGDTSGLFTKSNFTIDDVMKIEPCWPRIPYNTYQYQEANTLPLFESENGKANPESYGKVSSCLRTFGYKSFRAGQSEATARIISGLSTLVILSTGSGKSLCYQLPAYLYYKEKGWITIVISPLIALMQDQVAGLPSCLPGACLNGNMTKLQQQRVVTKLKEGKLALLLVSPETLVSGGFGYGMLPPKSSLPPIAFACIDEAHCLSEWSHNFRPSYLKVCKVLQDRYNIKCLLGLTATASLATAKSVVQHLGIKSEGSIIRDPHPVPQNLQITASRDSNRDQALIELLQLAPFHECDSIIVYTTRRTETERLAEKLRTCLPDYVPSVKDEEDEIEKKKKEKKIKAKPRKKAKPFWWNVECYHAGLTPAARKSIQNDFMSGELRIVVATVAFGMGLDKADVRSVIHYNMPKSFENYVQEIGRAGRDGKPAFCHVFLSEESGDLNEIRRHIYANSIDRRTVDDFINLTFPPCRCAELNKKHMTKNNEDEEVTCHTDNLPVEKYRWEDTMQSLSDDEMDMLFSEQFDDECKENIDAMESEINNDMHDTESHIEDSASVKEKCKVESCESPTIEENVQIDVSENMEPIKCNEAKLVHDDNSLEPVENKDVENEPTVCTEDVPTLCTADAPTVCTEDAPTVCTENDDDIKSEKINSDLNYCSGHRICISIDDTVAALDMPEENIATLMSYLELSPKKWLEVLNPLRAFATVKCYGGPEQFQLLAKKFHPFALAVRYCINDDPEKLRTRREIDFNFGEVADIMCWDVITVAREVRSLQWNMDFALDKQLNNTGKSGVIVECEQLSFHVVTAEGIDDDEKDEICDFLHEAVLKQEETRLLQLDALYTSLRKLSTEHYWQIKSDIRVDTEMRKCIGNYFMSDEEQQLKILHEMCGTKVEEMVPERKWNGVANDIRTLLIVHPDTKFTGRSLARIFHGIGSPCFPAINFGRDRRFWRCYLELDFNELRIFSVKILNRLKGINNKL